MPLFFPKYNIIKQMSNIFLSQFSHEDCGGVIHIIAETLNITVIFEEFSKSCTMIFLE